MAPRRKLGKPDLTSRLKAKPPCKAFCKPCCYMFAALSIVIGEQTLNSHQTLIRTNCRNNSPSRYFGIDISIAFRPTKELDNIKI